MGDGKRGKQHLACQNQRNVVRALVRFFKRLLRQNPSIASQLLKVTAGLICVGLLLVAVMVRSDPGFNRPEDGLESAQLRTIDYRSDRLSRHPLIYGSIYVDKFYDLNPSTRTFTADGSFWLQWSGSVQDIIEANNISIDNLVRLKNRIDISNSVMDPETPDPIELSAGRYQQRFIFSSRFYDDAIDFRRHPFNQLTLPIVVELMPEAMTSKYADVLLIPQPNQGSLVGESGAISGYELKADSLRAFKQAYRNTFGSWHKPSRSQMRLEVLYSANVWSAFFSWVLPLLIVNSIVLMAPSVEGSLGDIRLAIPSTALLTLIFLQQSYHAGLPRLPYTTYLDNLFSCSYVISMALFALFTWGANAYTKAPEDGKELAMMRINRVDDWFQFVSICGLVLVAVLGWVIA